MIQELPTAEPTLDSWGVWDRLLGYLDERSVIPIVGPDLIHVEMDGDTTRLDLHIAKLLAQDNQLSIDNLPVEQPLHYVVYEILRKGKKERNHICDAINEIMKKTAFRPSQTLRRLAEITAFNLFVTTTFDPLLERALQEVRFHDQKEIQSYSYSPSEEAVLTLGKKKLTGQRSGRQVGRSVPVVDLPMGKEKLTEPVVYYLFGKLTPTGRYVISDEELLEYVCAIQSPVKRPVRLFDELKVNHLLILGEEFSDWLARIFLRTTRGSRLSEKRDFIEILTDRRMHSDAGLVAFLSHFSKVTEFWPLGAEEFIDELWKRWLKHRPQVPVVPEELPGRDMPKNSIFLSYAKEDFQKAQRLKAGLEAAGLHVWFDIEKLKPGDKYNPKIAQYIMKECSCFLAVISQNTEKRLWGYFRREWYYAVDREKEFHTTQRFIIPIIVDDTTQPKQVPPAFEESQYAQLPGGTVSPEFVKEMRETVTKFVNASAPQELLS